MLQRSINLFSFSTMFSFWYWASLLSIILSYRSLTCSSASSNPLLFSFSVFFISLLYSWALTVFFFSYTLIEVLSLSTLLSSLVIALMTITLNFLLGILLMSTLLSSFSVLLSCLSFGSYSFVSPFCLILYVYVYVLDRSDIFPGFESHLCKKRSYGALWHNVLWSPEPVSTGVSPVCTESTPML